MKKRILILWIKLKNDHPNKTMWTIKRKRETHSDVNWQKHQTLSRNNVNLCWQKQPQKTKKKKKSERDFCLETKEPGWLSILLFCANLPSQKNTTQLFIALPTQLERLSRTKINNPYYSACTAQSDQMLRAKTLKSIQLHNISILISLRHVQGKSFLIISDKIKTRLSTNPLGSYCNCSM